MSLHATKIKGLNEELNEKKKEADLLRRVQELARLKAEGISHSTLRRSKSMKMLLSTFSKRRSLDISPSRRASSLATHR